MIMIDIKQILFFFLFSMLEYVAVFNLMFTLFRMPTRPYLTRILYVGFIMCMISFFVRYNLNLSDFATILQIAFAVISIVLLWRFQWYYAFIMSNIAFSLYGILQIFWFFIFQIFQIMRDVTDGHNHDGIGFNELAQFSQVVCVLSTFLICYIIKRFNGGWSYVSDNDIPIDLSKGKNRSLFFTTGIATVIMAILSFNNIGFWLYHTVVLLILVFIVLLYLSKRMESEQEDDSFHS